MTIQGAIAELQDLIRDDDIPAYYKGGIQKVIETIQMELAKQTEQQAEMPEYAEWKDAYESMVSITDCAWK